MRFRVPATFCSAALLALAAPQDGSSPEADKDVYQIYSLMLTNPQTSHGPDNNERFLIAATTRTGYPGQPCVAPPRERTAEFQEVLNDYEARKEKPRNLKPQFSLSKPYALLNDDEVNEFHSHRPDARFVGVADLFTLYDVYFNQQHTLALTGIATWCGGLCGLLQWKVFEKVDAGKWEERPWVTCKAVAQASHWK